MPSRTNHKPETNGALLTRTSTPALRTATALTAPSRVVGTERPDDRTPPVDGTAAVVENSKGDRRPPSKAIHHPLPGYKTTNLRKREGAGVNAADSNATGQLSVLCVHCNEVSRWGLTAMLSAIPVVSAAPSCTVDEAVPLLCDYSFDVLIADGMAQQALGRIVRAATERGTKTLILLRDTSRQSIVYATSLAIDGFLLECTLDLRALNEALLRLQHGEVPLPPQIAKEMLAQLRNGQAASTNTHFMLTPREQQALRLLAAGLSNKQIARRLGISEHGAKRHVANVLAKMNCPNRTLAAAFALKHGLLEPNE